MQQTELVENKGQGKDEMKKSIKLMIFITVAILFGLGFFLTSKGVQITIKNQTEEPLYNLSLELLSGTSKEYISIKSMNSGETTSIPIELPNGFTEGSISLCYYDKNNISHKETIIGYVEQGYNINVQLTIEAIDSEGNLKISIQ